jgi:dolichol-phosphate mannosyltransferase
MKPLQLSTFFGVIFASFAFIYGSIAIFMKFFTNTTVSGWTSLLVSVLFIGGIQLIMLGIIGEYLGNIFIESKKRPNFIIKEKSLD